MRLFTFLSLSLFVGTLAHGQEACHFSKADIPRSEARSSALAGVREFRCDYTLPRFEATTRLYARVFQDGKPVKTIPLSWGIGDVQRPSTTGIISIGWQADSHTLTSVYDTGMFSPTGMSVHLDGYEFDHAAYFPTSSPAKPGIELYPVMGLNSSPRVKMSDTAADGDAFLRACATAQAHTAIIIYLSYRTGDPFAE